MKVGLNWLGKPANLASKLTDLAGKEAYAIRLVRRMLQAARRPGQLLTTSRQPVDRRPGEFSEKLTKATEQDPLRYDGRLAYSWSRRPLTKHAILLTQEVYDGLRAQHPTSKFLTRGLLEISTMRVKGYAGRIYGTDAYFLAVQQTR